MSSRPPDAGPAVPPPMAPDGFCARWKARAAGALPGFATDSECVDFTGLETGDVPCGTAPANASASIADVFLAQTHFMAPSTADITMNDAGEPLLPNAVRPAFRLVTHRPALLKVGITGDGASPEVKVIGRRQGMPLGELCLKGPATLVATRAMGQNLDDSFLVNLPSSWIRPGLELEIRAGGASRMIPAAELRVAGGVRHMVVDMPVRMFGQAMTYPLPNLVVRYGSNTPVQSQVWSRFPVPVDLDPFVIPPKNMMPARIQAIQLRNFDEIAEVLDVAALLQRANGQEREASYYGNLGPRIPGGLGVVGGGAASGANSIPIFRHELGHTYGLGHLEPMYDEKRFPYLRNRMGAGGGVGPYWAYMPIEKLVFSPFLETDPGLYKRDAMAGGDGADNFYGYFTVQVITDYMQGRGFYDDEKQTTVLWNAQAGDFLPEQVQNDGFYFRPAQRDVPVYTIWGYYDEAIPAVNVIEPVLNYRGNLLKVMDPTSEEHLGWLRSHPTQLCNGGCDFIVRVTFDGTRVKSYLIRLNGAAFRRWAINVPATEGESTTRITRIEVFRRTIHNSNDTASPNHVQNLTAATILDAAIKFAEKTF